jgi:phytoene/squalene synthetase
MKELFDQISFEVSKLATKRYSTSFSLGIRFIEPKIRNAIYAIYGFVRFADEIVDTFHDYNKEILFERFKDDTYKAIEEGISLNPILNSFQDTVKKFGIDNELIATFLKSMEMDLHKNRYDYDGYNEYIVGSAEVVGLMCLKVYCNGDEKSYKTLKYYAERLGSAYQKINFLRDLSADYHSLGRVYFPGIDIIEFNECVKQKILMDIEKDFLEGYKGILRLPKNSRFGVYLSYIYFYSLFQKIRFMPTEIILQKRIRIPDSYKFYLFFNSYVKNKLHLIQWQN